MVLRCFFASVRSGVVKTSVVRRVLMKRPHAAFFSHATPDGHGTHCDPSRFYANRKRYTLIETISFSSDSSRIVATRLTARDARTPLKFYKSNVARTLSWMDSATGEKLGVIHQDFKPGNSGTAFRHWRVGRTSVVCNPVDDRIAFSAFGGGGLESQRLSPRIRVFDQ